MIRSMTAFARLEAETTSGSYVWEMRSVNHRYLEPSFRLSENFREIEPSLREVLRKRLARGKIEIALKVAITTGAEESIKINQALLKQILDANSFIQQQSSDLAPANTLDVLRWPNLLEAPDHDFKAMQQEALTQFDQLLNQFIEAREREGGELKKMISSRLDEMSTQIESVRQRMPVIIESQKQKLKEKIADAQVQVDSDRLEQEIVILAQKVDVDEEMDRLETHIDEVKRVLKKGGPAGRRLDFLMQELNREANTLASKSIDAQTTQSAVELKVLIEQMREQVQNIE